MRQARWAEDRPDEGYGILDFVGSLSGRTKPVKQKERTRKNLGRKPPCKPSVDGFGKPAVAGTSFFLLEQKEPKIQDKPGPSGRFVWPLRAWVVIVMAMSFFIVVMF